MSTAEISLYFGVEDGKNADLEAIARASLEWIEAIRDMASIIAPETEVEIEFLQTKEGSVWLKNLIKAVRGPPCGSAASVLRSISSKISVTAFGVCSATIMKKWQA